MSSTERNLGAILSAIIDLLSANTIPRLSVQCLVNTPAEDDVVEHIYFEVLESRATSRIIEHEGAFEGEDLGDYIYFFDRISFEEKLPAFLIVKHVLRAKKRWAHPQRDQKRKRTAATSQTKINIFF